MKVFTHLCRLIQINYIFARYGVNEVVLDSLWLRSFNYLLPSYWANKKKYTLAVRIRLALEHLGPIFIKAGQILSTRRDLIDDEVAEELAKLQDQVTPFPGVLAQAIIEQALAQPLTEVFLSFDLVPLASASIAQVHAATLLDGKEVVIKVLRPDLKKILKRDIDLLFLMADLVNRFWLPSRNFKAKEVVTEIATTLYDELDFMREAANGSQLRRNFLGSDSLYIPEMIWPLCRNNILVMERIYGISIYNIVALQESGVNLKALAERGIEIFFTQVFRDSFFHADMHPGNIFVALENKEKPLFLAVDFGIVGALNSKDQRYLAENMLAFFKRDYQRVAELHIDSGWLSPDVRVDQFAGAIRAVCEPIFARPLKEISFGQLLLRLFQTARRFEINIQPQLILLQKTLLNIEGIARQIYPDLDMWTTATPYLEKWLKRQVGTRAFLTRVKKNLPFWSEKLPEIPGLIYEILSEKKQQQEIQRFKPEIPVGKLSYIKIVFICLLSGFFGAFVLLLLQKFYF